MNSSYHGPLIRDLSDSYFSAAYGNNAMSRRSVRWVVWCKHCNAWHKHGPAEGHREAHCEGRTPYTSTGYNLAQNKVV